jgi:hypothetical protein
MPVPYGETPEEREQLPGGGQGDGGGIVARRRYPQPNGNVIARFAEWLWPDPALRGIFERVGLDGPLSDDDRMALRLAAGRFRCGDYRKRDDPMSLVEGLIIVGRLRAAGRIETFDRRTVSGALRDWYNPFRERIYRDQVPRESEIVAIAERLWAYRDLRAAFERAGLHGELKPGEERWIDGLIDIDWEGRLDGRCRSCLALAEVLARRRAAGAIARFDDADARAFLADRMAPHIDRNSSAKACTIDEVLGLAQYMAGWPGIRAAIDRRRPDEWATEAEAELFDVVQRRYIRKYGLYHRHGLVHAHSILTRLLADGISPDVNDSVAREYTVQELKMSPNGYRE